MKYIDYSFNGGMPLSQNILQFSQNGLIDAVKALCARGYAAGTPIIISGCEYNSTTNDVTAGWIYDGAELLYFPGGNTVTAGTNLIKIAETTTTVVFESGASQPIYKTRQYAFDNTGAINVTSIRKFGNTATTNIETDAGVTELVGQINVTVNAAARYMHISGYFVTLTAAAYPLDGHVVKIIDDAVLEADSVFGAYYPPNQTFNGSVIDDSSFGGVYNDLNSNPIQVVSFTLNNAGLYVNLRKTSSGNYPIMVNTFLFLD